MAVLSYLLDLYFAAVLGISGIAKLEQRGRFASTLRQHRLLPSWSVRAISSIFPFVEIAVAAMLVTGIAAEFFISAVLALFCAFFVVEMILWVTKRSEDCGCYGVAFVQKVGRATVATSALLVCLAALRIWMETRSSAEGGSWRLIAGCTFVLFATALMLRVVQRRQQLPAVAESPVATRLKNGDPFPPDVNFPLPAQAILLFVSATCGPCVDLCRRLPDHLASNWSVIVVAHRDTANEAEQQGSILNIPPYMEHVEDPADAWFRRFGGTARPAALAFNGGRLVNQRIAPSLDWLRDPAAHEEQRIVVYKST